MSIAPGVPPPDPGLLSPRRESNQRGAKEGDTFDCVPLLRTTPRTDIFKGASPPRQRGYPPCRLDAWLHLNDMAPRRRGAGFFGGCRPPRAFRGAKTYLYKKTLALGAKIKIDQAENRLPCGHRNVGAAPLDESIPLTGRQAQLE